MLPTKGYFQDIECPFYNTTCGRPYCHFRHKRKPNETVEDNGQETSKNIVPTYKPTPKSELANIHNNKSHIPISYVPDLSYQRERTARPIIIDKPTYKPTPLSILSSATRPDSSLPENHEHQETIKDIQENIASNIYDPLKSEIDFEDLSNEFELIDDIINDSEEGPQGSINDNLIQLANDIEKEQNRLNLLQSRIEEGDLSKNHGLNNYDPLVRAEFSSDESDQSEQVGKESKTIPDKKETEEVVIEEGKPNKKPLNSNKNSRPSKNIDSHEDHKNDKDSKSSHKDRPKSTDAKNVERSSSKEKSNKEKDLKRSEKSSKTHKSSEREKHRKEEKKNSGKESETSKESKEKLRSKSKIKAARSRSPEQKKNDKKHSKNKSECYSSSSGSSPEKHRKEKKSDSSKIKKSKIRDKSHSRSEKRDKKIKFRSKSRSTSREKLDKSKHKSKKRSQSPTKDEDKKHSKNKEVKKKNSKDKDRTKTKEEAKSSSREKTSSRTSKKSPENKKDKRKHNYNTSDNDNDQGIFLQESFMDTEDLIPSDVDLDLEDEDETMRECYKIFNEYKPEPIKQPKVEEVEKNNVFEEDDNTHHGKKRRAHAGAENLTSYSKLPPIAPPKTVVLPGQILTNRYKIAKMAQASNEQANIMNEVKNITQQSVKRPATSLLEAARLHKIKRLQQQKAAEREKEKPKVNVVDDILNGVHRPSPSQIKTLPKKIAAVPNVALIEKAKLRISLVKQKRLENVKTIAHTQKGTRVAHVPEYSLADIPDVLQADKSKLPVNVRTRFLTMIADECSKLYALKEDAFNRALNEEFSCYEKCKVLATYRNSAMLAVNRLRKETQDRESKGMGPLLSGESSINKKETDFEGNTFYNHVKKWLLTDEELDIHGYPRESEDRGKAIIRNRTEIDYSIIDENQKKCSRCGKIFQVDDDGWPLFEEECMYHPLKKRTIRGEQVFLCCKSNDDTGCATSDTHVFDGLQKHLLEGYQTTLPPESDDDARSLQVYALDCEMCYTTKGLELTRVTIVDTDCKTVYESFVKPLNPIIDYNTRFSGITKDQMDRTSTNILQVQANILHLCNSETILVGHSLESDMKALKIVHGTIIDTSLLFPHKMGLPHKRALRALASEYLKKIIQNDVAGHDSAEDAVACMDLIKWKLKEELKTRTK